MLQVIDEGVESGDNLGHPELTESGDSTSAIFLRGYQHLDLLRSKERA